MAQDAQVIVLASQKGGSGKTTLSGHIAVAAQQSGAGPVALIDTDPQGSLSKWWNARRSETPFFVQTSVDRLEHDLGLLRESGIKLFVIDTPPAVTSAITEVIAHADLVVVPTRPSPHDLRAVGLTVDIVEHQKKPLVFVVNCATARARITGETAVSLSQHGTVAPATIHNRVDFAASMIDGRTVGEVSATSRSSKEVAALWRYLEDRLRRLRPEAATDKPVAGNRFEMELLTPVPMSNGQPAASATALVAKVREGYGMQAPTVSDAGVTNASTEEEWDGVERRGVDQGPPSGVSDRRKVATFGRRHLQAKAS